MYKEMRRLEKENRNLIGQICAGTDYDRTKELLKTVKKNAETVATMKQQEKQDKTTKRKELFKKLTKKS